MSHQKRGRLLPPRFGMEVRICPVSGLSTLQVGVDLFLEILFTQQAIPSSLAKGLTRGRCCDVWMQLCYITLRLCTLVWQSFKWYVWLRRCPVICEQGACPFAKPKAKAGGFPAILMAGFWPRIIDINRYPLTSMDIQWLCWCLKTGQRWRQETEGSKTVLKALVWASVLSSSRDQPCFLQNII